MFMLTRRYVAARGWYECCRRMFCRRNVVLLDVLFLRTDVQIVQFISGLNKQTLLPV